MSYQVRAVGPRVTALSEPLMGRKESYNSFDAAIEAAKAMRERLDSRGYGRRGVTMSHLGRGVDLSEGWPEECNCALCKP